MIAERQVHPMFPEPFYCLHLLSGLEEVVEIGGSWHNPYHLISRACGRYRNISYDPLGYFSKYDNWFAGQTLPVDIEADALSLPLEDDSVDAVIASHVLEHIWNPIGALMEWMRVVRAAPEGMLGQHGQPTGRGGFVYLVIPHKDRMTDERCADRTAPLTTVTELTDRYTGFIPQPEDYPGDTSQHRSFWTPKSFLEFVEAMRRSHQWLFKLHFEIEAFLSRDENVGNGFVCVLRKVTRRA